MSTKSPRTDPRVLRTRQLIRDAFIDLLQEIELEKITVNRIAERATINRVTFYLHYRDIPDMLERIADDMIKEIHAILEDVRDQSHVDLDWSTLLRMLEHIAENSKFYKVLLASKRISVFTDRLMNLMVDVITIRFEKRDASSSDSAVSVPKDIAIWYGSSAFIGTIVCWLRNDMPYTPLFLAKQLSLLFRLHQNTTSS
ncbi:TetR family transcriptional regulator [Paenibacillus baekrokdamisoli]|uniref:TetR family transcriptional regulator n=1 Tax=Paenibacillus baekrokdamisoli TaxID=1712516 RepID=A0A3G9JDM4_9BACL|nr:TetR/AcrR family transcriptional regulator [Paenibacillus baekrokdamisoli]MBB3067880.1 AcrR family transcriptional regulator [Paenibacillus baekrokdamisoli]BBH23073.1 TetR family transcriptional regulator [Paenibacillus baekrokdamisoli]